jgi:hypothetical protein
MTQRMCFVGVRSHVDGDRTGWLTRQDSNLCISKSDLLNFGDLAIGRTPKTFREVRLAHLPSEMRNFVSCPAG